MCLTVSTEKTLQGLLKEQRTKVEEIKKKTNFYSTRDLLSKYDDQTPMNSPQPQQILRQRMNGAPPSIPQTPVAGMARPQTQGSNGSAASARVPQGVVNPELNGLSPSPFLATPTRKQWYDKLADALLGDEDQQTPPSSRYALICEKCFKHNGLVKESMWEDMQYICPKCGHFNQSMRSKRAQARRSASPGSVGSASPSNPVGPPSPTTPSPVRGAKINSGSPPPQTVSSPSSDKMDED
ncbi:hypothetical protein ONZ45_g16653 [Pleurotus djamor]|nr:hypothetical protein ONZ45_g16653 [Pleurotus djamor]